MLLLLQLRGKRWLRRWWGMTLLAVWVAFNLFTVNWRFNLEKPTEPPPFAPNGVVQFLQNNLSGERIVSGGLLPNGNSAASVHQLQDLTGNTPLQLAASAEFLNTMPSWRLWQLMNVHYIVDERDIADPGLSLVFEEPPLKIFQMGDPFERAWFVSQTEFVADSSQTLARLAADDFDLRQSAVIPKPLPLSLDTLSEAVVTVTAFDANHLILQTQTNGQTLLVLSQIYYPGWYAEVDGQSTEIIQVNAVQQGVVVPSGEHDIRVYYWPNSFKWGVGLSVIGLIFCGIGLAMGLQSKPFFEIENES